MRKILIKPKYSRLFGKIMLKTLKISAFLQKSSFYSKMKSLQNRETENIKSEKEAPARSNRYTEMHKSKKQQINERKSSTASARPGEVKRHTAHPRILPPSKERMGRRLRKHRDKDATVKNARNSCSPKNAININERIPHTALAAGPARQSRISSLYEHSCPFMFILAPKSSNENDDIGMRSRRAAQRCPSSCKEAADKASKV